MGSFIMGLHYYNVLKSSNSFYSPNHNLILIHIPDTMYLCKGNYMVKSLKTTDSVSFWE